MKLTLFFTYNTSLEVWVQTGLFDREKQLYEEYLRRGYLKKVYWLTYGKNDAELAEQLKASGRLQSDIEILAIPRFFSGKWGCLLYSLLIPLIYRRQLQETDVFKTNQMNGSWSAVIVKWLYRRPLIVRTGFPLSLFVKNIVKSKRKNKIYEWIEQFAYRHADISIVSRLQDKQYICSKYRMPEENVKVLYNYIDPSNFYPVDGKKYRDRIIFTGRLTPQKNLFSLIKAIAATNFTLDIFGNGQLRHELECQSKRLNARVNFMGAVPNEKIPQILNRYCYYILPSFYEGMPKALLEAMACGLVCIGTNVDGINEVIRDGVNGYIAKGTDTKSLIEAIKRAAEQPDDLIKREATRTIRNNFTLERFIQKEKDIIERLSS